MAAQPLSQLWPMSMAENGHQWRGWLSWPRGMHQKAGLISSLNMASSRKHTSSCGMVENVRRNNGVTMASIQLAVGVSEEAADNGVSAMAIEAVNVNGSVSINVSHLAVSISVAATRRSWRS